MKTPTHSSLLPPCPPLSFYTGTGKTTIITHRLLHKERAYMQITHGDMMTPGTTTSSNKKREEGEGEEGVRQAIITTSPRLCVAIKKTVTRSRK